MEIAFSNKPFHLILVQDYFHPILQMEKLRFLRAEKSACGLKCVQTANVLHTQAIVQQPGGLPCPSAMSSMLHEWGTPIPPNPAAQPPASPPLISDHSGIKQRSRSPSPALMKTPRVSNYNKEEREESESSLSQGQINFNFI